jgi:DNA-binding transcriptional MerR regulator
MEPTDLPSSESLTQPEASTEESVKMENLGRSLEEAEELLNHVKARFAQVQSSQEKKTALQARLSELNAEIESIQAQLATTWEELESQLITWRDKEERFWQFLRFSGVGFALAMLLNYLIK